MPEAQIQISNAARNLTRAERKFVERGCIFGDFSMQTISNLQGKGLMYLHIDSPNGRAGFMRLTPLGESVQALIKSRKRRPLSSAEPTKDNTNV